MTAVAIDGPAGAGKSTAARAAAKRLGFVYVDTGALYRAVGCHMRALGIPAWDARQVEKALEGLEVSLEFSEGGQHVLLNGRDVTGELRTPEASLAASQFSALPCVRSFLFGLQQQLAERHSVVMDGRDIGTVVLPKAQVKVFLTASPEERARRRFEEMRQKGENAEYQQVLEELQQRDYQDAHRAVAPLKPAEDAVLLDTTGLSLQDVVERLVALVNEKLK